LNRVVATLNKAQRANLAASFVCIAAVYSPLADAGAKSAQRGLCSSGEHVYFACQTASKKWVSVCGAKPSVLSLGSGELQYRFGKSPSRIELKFPENPHAGREAIAYAHYFRAQVDRTELSFRHNDTNYAVFDYSEDGKRTSGVRVANANGKESQLDCKGAIRSRMSELEGILKCDSESALSAGDCVRR
jgi:hypothetical protein